MSKQGSMHSVRGRCSLARQHALGARKMQPCKAACTRCAEDAALAPFGHIRQTNFK
uniref:Uncharacterized protein n=1 Tax=Cucumis melo TaxID=3656 RepID=A0A9I9CSZ7_CUCME